MGDDRTCARQDKLLGYPERTRYPGVGFTLPCRGGYLFHASIHVVNHSAEISDARHAGGEIVRVPDLRSLIGIGFEKAAAPLPDIVPRRQQRRGLGILFCSAKI